MRRLKLTRLPITLCSGVDHVTETSPVDHVVDPGDHRLARIGSEFGHDRNERRAECLERLLGLPDVEDLDLPVRLKGEMVGASLGRSGAGLLEPSNHLVIALRSEPAGAE